MMINSDGYLTRKGCGKRACSYDWFLGKDKVRIVISNMPQRYLGKHFRIKIEIMEAKT